MKRVGFAAIPDRPHYWLADARAQACLIEGSPLGKPDFEGLVRCDIEIRDGRIAAIAPLGTAPAGAVDLRGGLVWPGFVDIHTHLDKGHIWPRSPNPDGSFLGAVGTTLGDRAARWSAEDVRRRMEFGLACAWAQGTVAVRTHIDSLAPQAEISWPVLKALRDAWSGRIELQATCLMSMDAFAEPQGARLADIVADAGGILGCSTRLVGGAHEALPPGFLERLGFKGRLQCGHCCSLAMQPDEFVADTLRAVAQAGIAIVSLPMCNMYLQGRTAGRTPRWRGITLLHELCGEGIDVSIASDNCRDPFYAFGDHDMLEVMTQATRIAHLDHPFGEWPTSFTSVPAEVMGLADHGRLKVGAPADLVLLSARFMSEMLSRSQADRVVLRGGGAIDTSLPDYRELDGLLGAPA